MSRSAEQPGGSSNRVAQRRPPSIPLEAPPSPGTGLDRHPSKTLLETVVQQTVDDRIDAAVAVCEQMQGCDYRPVPVMQLTVASVEKKVDLSREEGKPGDGEEDDDDDQHPNHSLLLGRSTAGIDSVPRRRFDHRRPVPEGDAYPPVGDEDDEDWENVEENVEEDGVGDVQAMVRKEFDAHIDDVQRGVRSVVCKDTIETLNEQLRNQDDSSHQPEAADQEKGSSDRMKMTGLKRTADGIVSTTTKYTSSP